MVSHEACLRLRIFWESDLYLARGALNGLKLALRSRAGRYWSRRESRGLPPPGTQETIDRALESCRWGGSVASSKKQLSSEIVCARDADQISISQRPTAYAVVDDGTFRPLSTSPSALMRRLKRCGAPLLVPALLLLLLGMHEPRHRSCCSCGGHHLANIVFHAEI